MLRAIDRTSDCGFASRVVLDPVLDPDLDLDRGGGPPGSRQSDIRNSLNPEPRTPNPRAFTLVEMLVAMAITLVMMGAVVTLFANVSNSVRDRRATIEMSGQLRHARNMLQQDMQGATCPGLTWRRPEENQGYIEIIEGPYREGSASALIDGDATNGEIDHTTSIIPASNLPFTTKKGQDKWATDGAGLGDADDILMLTVRNEHEPFVGNMPAALDVRPNANNANTMDLWKNVQTIESPLAEVVWYAVENPLDDDKITNHFFGEPGMRTIYRRTLLIAPWVNPYRYTDPTSGVVTDTFKINRGTTFVAKPGLVRILPSKITPDVAIAGLIAFQERYDLSVRLEFDPLMDSANGGRWKIVANTLGDLTKRENRYEHHFYAPAPPSPFQPGRFYPFAVASSGSSYSGGSPAVTFINDPELVLPVSFLAANATAQLTSFNGGNGIVGAFTVSTTGKGYPGRPFAFVSGPSDTLATVRAMLNDDGSVIRLLPGLVPLSGSRRGEDVMLSDALAFDLRVYDPGAPLFGVRETPGNVNSEIRVVLEPTDPAWWKAYEHPDNMDAVGISTGKNQIGNNNATYPFVGQGAYVDMGYGFIPNRTNAAGLPAPPALPPPVFFSPTYSSAIVPWFFTAKPLTHVNGNALAPGYAVYDTWSFHYENNGVNEDGDTYFDPADGLTKPRIDQGTNGLDDKGWYFNSITGKIEYGGPINGPDDVGERETAPPYDKPLRGIQAILRVYERDSRQIRQVSVDQHFVPE